jgi:competence protein ComEA
MRFVSSMLLTAGLALSVAAWGGPVDINSADASTLAKELNGVGPSRAKAIVAYRNEHGPFKSVDDLALVKNMPQKIIDSNRDLLRVGAGGSPREGKGARDEGKPAAAKPEKKAAAQP